MLLMENTQLQRNDTRSDEVYDQACALVMSLGASGDWETRYAATVGHADGEHSSTCVSLDRWLIFSHRRGAFTARSIHPCPIHTALGSSLQLSFSCLPQGAAHPFRRSAFGLDLEHGIQAVCVLDSADSDRAQDPPSTAEAESEIDPDWRLARRRKRNREDG